MLRLTVVNSNPNVPSFLVGIPDDTSPLGIRTLLVVDIMNHQSWESGEDVLMEYIKYRTKAELTDNAREKVYWIRVTNSHWRYGLMADGDEDPTPLIPWHDVTHDDASYHDFVQLQKLVNHM